jgi:hypothetical protein
MVAVYLNSVDSDTHQIEYEALLDLCEQREKELEFRVPESSWPHLVRFFSKPWFYRMWTIQEFAMGWRHSPVLLFFGGFRVLPERDLFFAALAIFKIDLIPVALNERTAMYHGLKQYLSLFKVKVSLNTPNSLSSLLWTFRDRCASDPRDKIYSLLGFLQASNTLGVRDLFGSIEAVRLLKVEDILIDYQAPIKYVYAILVRAVVLGTESLNMICACQRPGGFERSWVPDWSEPWSRVSLTDEYSVQSRRGLCVKTGQLRVELIALKVV